MLAGCLYIASYGLQLVHSSDDALRGEELLLDRPLHVQPVHDHLARLRVAAHAADGLHGLGLGLGKGLGLGFGFGFGFGLGLGLLWRELERLSSSRRARKRPPAPHPLQDERRLLLLLTLLLGRLGPP